MTTQTTICERVFQKNTERCICCEKPTKDGVCGRCSNDIIKELSFTITQEEIDLITIDPMQQDRMTDIVREVFNMNNIPFNLNQIKLKSRKIEKVMLKKVAIIALTNAGFSQPKIAAFLEINHATVNHHIHHSAWHQDFRLTHFPSDSKAAIMGKIEYHKDQIKMLEGELRRVNG